MCVYAYIVDEHTYFICFRFEKYKKSEGDKIYAFVGYMTAYNYYAYPEKIRPRIR